jgi:two-component system alkaline phosphatase synthesis response regulator PhoP
MKVLIIDDEEDVRRIACLSLVHVGHFLVVEAGSGEEGLVKARSEQPDAILLDAMMPVIDGPATLAKLREDAATRHIPVVFVTASSTPAEVDRLRALGVKGVLTKPFNAMTLAYDLESMILASPMTHEVLDPQVLDPQVLDPLIQLQQRSGVPILAEIRELFLSALPDRLATLRTAVETGDSKGIQQAAHAFRSAAGNLGAVRLCALCRQIETVTREKDLDQAARLVPELIAESARVAAALRAV